MEAKTKKFDCVEMKRKGAARVRSEIDGLNTSEQLAYWGKGTAKLLVEQEALREGARRGLSEGHRSGTWIRSAVSEGKTNYKRPGV